MPTDLSQLDILVVDDNAQMCMLLRTYLKAFGIKRVRLANTGEVAFEVLARRPATLIFLDWIMEPMSGLEFLRRLRHSDNEPHCHTPVIMISAHGDADKVIEARAMGVSQFLTKPISPDILHKRLVWAMENPLRLVRNGDYFLPAGAKAPLTPRSDKGGGEGEADEVFWLA